MKFSTASISLLDVDYIRSAMAAVNPISSERGARAGLTEAGSWWLAAGSWRLEADKPGTYHGNLTNHR